MPMRETSSSGSSNDFSLTEYLPVQFVLIAMLAFGAVSVWLNTEKSQEAEESGTFLPFGPSAGRHVGAAMPAGFLGFLTLDTALVLHVVLLPDDGSFVRVLLICVMLGGFALPFVVFLFRRPLFLVPPHMRGDTSIAAALVSRGLRRRKDEGR